MSITNYHLKNEKENETLNVGILIYNEVYLLDFAGPLEVFFDTYSEQNKHLFNVYTISQTCEIKAHCGTIIQSDYNLFTCPKPHILIIPGGKPDLLKDNSELLHWLINTANEAHTVMSVCTGAFILAQAKLLNNLNITSWYGSLEMLKKIVPSANIIENVRFTVNDKFITTAGISAGIDGSLYVISKYFGKQVADSTARYLEYENWK